MASKSTATAVLPALSSAPLPPPNGGVRRQREDDEYNASSSSTAAAAARIARMTTESVPRSAEGDETNANNNNNNNRAEGGSSSHHRQHQQHQQRHSGGAVAASDSNRHHQQQPHVPEGGGTSIVASFAHSPYARGPGYGLHRESSSSELEQQALGGATTGGNSAPPYRSEIRRSNGAFAPNSNSTENDAAVHRSRRAEGDPHQHAYYAGEAALSASPLMLGADSANGSSINRSRHGRGHNGNNQAASSAASQPFHHYLPSSRRPHNHNPSASMVSHHPNHQHNHMFQPQQFSPFLEPAVVGSSNSNSADNFAPQASSLLLDHRRSEYQQGGTSWGGPSSSTTHGGNQNYPAHHHHPYDIQREFAVLQSSFAELQHQYGQKCGEVIVLQNTVAVLRDQLQEFEFVRQQQQQQQPQQSSAPPFTTSTVPTGGAAGSRNASSAAGRLRQRCPSADVSSGDDDGHSQRPAASATGVPAADIPDTFSSSVQAAGPNKHALNSNAPQQQQHPLKGASGAVLFCDLCQISVNSDTTLRAHLQGERHRKALHRAGAAVAAATAVPPGGEEPANNASDVIANDHSPEQASALPNDAMMMADPVEPSAASTTTITPNM